MIKEEETQSFEESDDVNKKEKEDNSESKPSDSEVKTDSEEPSTESSNILALPKVRKLAEEKGIDLSSIKKVKELQKTKY